MSASSDDVAAAPSGAVSFKIFPGEKPTVAEANAWRLSSLDSMPPSWRALLDGIPLDAAIQYTLRTVPPPLVAGDGPPVITQQMEESRQMLIDEIGHTNAIKTLQFDSLQAKERNSFFGALQRSLRPRAPLLLRRLEAAHPLGPPFAAWHDGPAAFTALVALFAANTQLEPEADEHEDFMTKLRLQPLSDGCSSVDFSSRVNDALQHHLPFLRRPFPVNDGSLGKWVISQMPSALAADGRRLAATLTIAQLSNGHDVADQCVQIVAAGQAKSVKDGLLGEFLGVQDDAARLSGRRPRGLGSDRGSRGGKGGGAGGRGAGQGGRSGSVGGSQGRGANRSVGCSVQPPRGPLCKYNHPSPCYRDPAWRGPLPAEVWNNAPRLEKLRNDRKANALRMSEPCFDLYPAEGAVEGVHMLDVDESQFDDLCPPCEDYDLSAAQELNDALSRGVDPSRAVLPPTPPAAASVLFADAVMLLDIPPDRQHEALCAGAVLSASGWTAGPDAQMEVLSEWVARAPVAFSAESSPPRVPPAHGGTPSWWALGDPALGPCRVQQLTHEQWLLLDGADVVLRSFGRGSTSEQEARAWAAQRVGSVLRGAASSDLAAAAPPDGTPHAAAAAAPTQPLPPPVAAPLRAMPPMLKLVTACVVVVALVCVAAGAGLAHAVAVVLGSAAEHGGVVATSHIFISATVDRVLTAGALHPFAAGSLASAVVILLSFWFDADAVLASAARVLRRAGAAARQRAGLCVMIIFIWSMVIYSHAATCDDHFHLTQMVSDYSNDIDFSRHMHLATHVTSIWSDVEFMPHMHSHDSLVLLFDGTAPCTPDAMAVFDTGAKRPVIRDPDAFDPSTRKPCPFRVSDVCSIGCTRRCEEELKSNGYSVVVCRLRATTWCIEVGKWRF